MGGGGGGGGGGGVVKVGLWSLVKTFVDGGCMNRWKTAINAISFTSSGSSHLRQSLLENYGNLVGKCIYSSY